MPRPDIDFAKTVAARVANTDAAPRVVALPRRLRRGAALAMFGDPGRTDTPRT
ncbi:hypothetical protein [Sulfitobacter sp. S190]|uniref:hypothetical protein n=1 Tax=Sulfitobacter sp. S190 TaxID=2867022 RepID=UPI0021A78001|nr:hypothetical protein [Sulfitobacter sp. S190]UWR21352.1 hypothetical protein K3756_11595 [Sulfitobacter sp. S190]